MDATAEVKDIKDVVEYTKALSIIITNFAARSREDIDAKLHEMSEVMTTMNTTLQAFKELLQKSITAHTERSLKADSTSFAVKEFIREPTAIPGDFADRFVETFVREADFVQNRDYRNYAELKGTAVQAATASFRNIKNNFFKHPNGQKYPASRAVQDTSTFSLARTLVSNFLRPTRAVRSQNSSKSEEVPNDKRLRETEQEFKQIADSVVLSEKLTKVLVRAWIANISHYYCIQLKETPELIKVAHPHVVKMLQDWPHVPDSATLDEIDLAIALCYDPVAADESLLLELIEEAANETEGEESGVQEAEAEAEPVEVEAEPAEAEAEPVEVEAEPAEAEAGPAEAEAEPAEAEAEPAEAEAEPAEAEAEVEAAEQAEAEQEELEPEFGGSAEYRVGNDLLHGILGYTGDPDAMYEKLKGSDEGSRLRAQQWWNIHGRKHYEDILMDLWLKKILCMQERQELLGFWTPKKKVASKKAGAKAAGVKKAGVKKAGVKNAGVKEAGVKEARVKNAGAKKAGAKKARAKKAGAKKVVPKRAGAKKELGKRKEARGPEPEGKRKKSTEYASVTPGGFSLNFCGRNCPLKNV